AKLFERAEQLAVRQVELRLDVRLAAGRADQRRLALRAEQEADRAGEDGLPGAGLAGDRVQAAVELELGAADEDEVVDPEPAQHGFIVRLRSDRAYRPLWTPNTAP